MAAKHKKNRRPPEPRAPRQPTALHNHAAALHSVMIEFQFLEEALRRCIELSYDIVRERTRGLLAFKLTRKDLETAALGRLIDTFAKLVGEEALVSELNGLKSDRNHCAHVAFMEATISSARRGVAELRRGTERYLNVYDRARAATGKVIQVLERLARIKATLP